MGVFRASRAGYRYTRAPGGRKGKRARRGRAAAMALPGLEPGRGVAPLDFESSASTIPPEGRRGRTVAENPDLRSAAPL